MTCSCRQTARVIREYHFCIHRIPTSQPLTGRCAQTRWLMPIPARKFSSHRPGPTPQITFKRLITTEGVNEGVEVDGGEAQSEEAVGVLEWILTSIFVSSFLTCFNLTLSSYFCHLMYNLRWLIPHARPALFDVFLLQSMHCFYCRNDC